MRRSKTLLLIAAASLAIPMVATVNAQAGSTLCPASRVCIYVDNDYIGLLGYRSAGGRHRERLSGGERQDVVLREQVRHPRTLVSRRQRRRKVREHVRNDGGQRRQLERQQ